MHLAVNYWVTIRAVAPSQQAIVLQHVRSSTKSIILSTTFTFNLGVSPPFRLRGQKSKEWYSDVDWKLYRHSFILFFVSASGHHLKGIINHPWPKSPRLSFGG